MEEWRGWDRESVLCVYSVHTWLVQYMRSGKGFRFITYVLPTVEIPARVSLVMWHKLRFMYESGVQNCCTFVLYFPLLRYLYFSLFFAPHLTFFVYVYVLNDNVNKRLRWISTVSVSVLFTKYNFRKKRITLTTVIFLLVTRRTWISYVIKLFVIVS